MSGPKFIEAALNPHTLFFNAEGRCLESVATRVKLRLNDAERDTPVELEFDLTDPDQKARFHTTSRLLAMAYVRGKRHRSLEIAGLIAGAH